MSVFVFGEDKEDVVQESHCRNRHNSVLVLCPRHLSILFLPFFINQSSIFQEFSFPSLKLIQPAMN